MRAREEETTQGQLDCRQCVQQPDVLWLPDQQEAAHGDGTKQVAQDQNVLTIASVGDDAGQWADEKRGEHSYRKQAPYGESGAGELCQKGSRGDQIEPVAQQARDLPEP